jgi:hypothetical protein
MTGRSLVLALLLMVPATVQALPWDGTYRLSQGADCDRVGEEGGALRIGEGVFEGVGATCRMTEPVDVLDLDATIYVLDCEGEGETWSERAMFMRTAEGDAIFILWRGYTFRYERCPMPEGASSAGDAPAEGSPPSQDRAPEEQAAPSTD